MQATLAFDTEIMMILTSLICKHRPQWFVVERAKQLATIHAKYISTAQRILPAYEIAKSIYLYDKQLTEA